VSDGPPRGDGPREETTRLALERTRYAGERTLMAWIRTALSMITFGFSVYKFFEYLHRAEPALGVRAGGPRHFGLGLTGLGVAVLILAGVQHHRLLRRLDAGTRRRSWSLALTAALGVALLGLYLFASILTRRLPL
jgi:putative membrane protein